MATIQELGDQLAALSLKDAVELGKYMKDTYGIEAAAGAVHPIENLDAPGTGEIDQSQPLSRWHPGYKDEFAAFLGLEAPFRR